VCALILWGCSAKDVASDLASSAALKATAEASAAKSAAKSAAQKRATEFGRDASSAAKQRLASEAVELKRTVFGLATDGSLSNAVKTALTAASKDGTSAEAMVARGARVAPVVVEVATVLNSAVDDETAIEPIYAPVSNRGDADKAIASMPTVEVVDGVTVGFKKLDSMTTDSVIKEEAVLVLWRRDEHLLGFVVRKKRSIDLAMLIKETPRLMKLFESSLR
jgi:hypothetical protein